jgi:hypothetical protein
VITPFAVFAAFALIRTNTAFINVDLSFPAASKNDSIRNCGIHQYSQTPDSRQNVERTAKEASIMSRNKQAVSENAASRVRPPSTPWICRRRDGNARDCLQSITTIPDNRSFIPHTPSCVSERISLKKNDLSVKVVKGNKPFTEVCFIPIKAQRTVF